MAALLSSLGISIHAPREGGDVVVGRVSRAAGMSIHAPREGGDATHDNKGNTKNISIHAPREGGDIILRIGATFCMIFQSTPPARGATVLMAALLSSLGISIHAPREGGD